MFRSQKHARPSDPSPPDVMPPDPDPQPHSRSRLRVPWRRPKAPSVGTASPSPSTVPLPLPSSLSPALPRPPPPQPVSKLAPISVLPPPDCSVPDDLPSTPIAAPTLLPIRSLPTALPPTPSITPSINPPLTPSLTPLHPDHHLTADSVPSDSISDDSFVSKAVAPTSSNPHQRHGPLHRLATLFRETDGRYEENLRSIKRRVVQIRRQPDSAPIRLQMGFRSRTGWEPIRATKHNQDCLIALIPCGPGSRYNLFAALDGHGQHGHHCAIFIAQRVVAYLKHFLLALPSKQTIANTLHRAIVYAEKKLHHITDIDFHLSGSTGVFVLLHSSHLFCANVGDSRAVIGREVSVSRHHPMSSDRPEVSARSRTLSLRSRRRYNPVPISFDHKPVRPDERERLEKSGARVDAWDSVDVGEERVWLPEARTPGLAVSRSFGDFLVKPYGVSAVPEIYNMELCNQDRFLVMASDGVFEFMTNEEVVDVVAKWRDRGPGSAQDAAEDLVRCATDRWIEDDSVIDDISCVVVYMDVVETDAEAPEEPQLMQVDLSLGNVHGTDGVAEAVAGEYSQATTNLSVIDHAQVVSRHASCAIPNGREPEDDLRPFDSTIIYSHTDGEDEDGHHASHGILS